MQTMRETPTRIGERVEVGRRHIAVTHQQTVDGGARHQLARKRAV